jgi:hypothetical protein
MQVLERSGVCVLQPLDGGFVGAGCETASKSEAAAGRAARPAPCRPPDKAYAKQTAGSCSRRIVGQPRRPTIPARTMPRRSPASMPPATSDYAADPSQSCPHPNSWTLSILRSPQITPASPKRAQSGRRHPAEGYDPTCNWTHVIESTGESVSGCGHVSRRTVTPPNSDLSQREQRAVRLCGWGQCCARFCMHR